ncbi:unnamed protein product [Ectocarpus sp. 6 AP-2014]
MLLVFRQVLQSSWSMARDWPCVKYLKQDLVKTLESNWGNQTGAWEA